MGTTWGPSGGYGDDMGTIWMMGTMGMMGTMWDDGDNVGTMGTTKSLKMLLNELR